MNLFPRRGRTAMEKGNVGYDRVVSRIDSALESIFTKDGKRTVLYFLAEKYSLSLEEAGNNPERLEAAMTNLLGEIGWGVVRRKILEEFSTGQTKTTQLSFQTRSLGEIFGAFRFIIPHGAPF